MSAANKRTGAPPAYAPKKARVEEEEEAMDEIPDDLIDDDQEMMMMEQVGRRRRAHARAQPRSPTHRVPIADPALARANDAQAPAHCVAAHARLDHHGAGGGYARAAR